MVAITVRKRVEVKLCFDMYFSEKSRMSTIHKNSEKVIAPKGAREKRSSTKPHAKAKLMLKLKSRNTNKRTTVIKMILGKIVNIENTGATTN
jgi:hypothetical protein